MNTYTDREFQRFDGVLWGLISVWVCGRNREKFAVCTWGPSEHHLRDAGHFMLGNKQLCFGYGIGMTLQQGLGGGRDHGSVWCKVCVFGHKATSPASHLTTTRTIWSEWIQAWEFPWLERVEPLSLASANTDQPPAWPSQEPSDPSGLEPDGPLS